MKRKLHPDRRYPVVRWLMTLGLLASLSSPVLANELWIAPEKQNQDKKVGNWAVANLGGETHFSFRVPDNMQTFTQAAVVLIPPADGPLTYDLHLNRTTNLMPHTANPVDLVNNVTPFLTAGMLTEIDVSTAFAGVAAQDYVSLNFELSGKQATTQVVGLRVTFIGPAGPQGPEGTQGPPGPSGALGLAGQTCPSGQFVTGFDLSGRIICAAPSATSPGGGGTPGGTPGGISLAAVAQLITNSLNGAKGNEVVAQPVTFNLGPVSVSFSLIGFALCQPPDLTAPPNQTLLHLYNCTPNAHVTVVTQANNSVTITVNVGHFYADLAGELEFLTITRTLDAFVLLEGVQVTLTAPLLDTGEGTKTLGAVSQTSVTMTDSQVQVHSDNTGLGSVIQGISNILFSRTLSIITAEIPSLVNPILAAVPPFILTP